MKRNEPFWIAKEEEFRRERKERAEALRQMIEVVDSYLDDLNEQLYKLKSYLSELVEKITPPSLRDEMAEVKHRIRNLDYSNFNEVTLRCARKLAKVEKLTAENEALLPNKNEWEKRKKLIEQIITIADMISMLEKAKQKKLDNKARLKNAKSRPYF